SKDPNQAVSGTFSYAISCGCPVITTPIPHALEALQNNAGVSIDFSNSDHLAKEVINLLGNESLRKQISSHGLHYMASSAWQNSALAHAVLFKQLSQLKIKLHYKLPPVELNHVKNLTTKFGIIQFCKLNEPDLESGYTLDDNARALITLCQHYELTLNKPDLAYIRVYLDFIGYCIEKDGGFKNYVSAEKYFTSQNETVNLADAGGRALWALGYTLYVSVALPIEITLKAKELFDQAIQQVDKIHSTRAMAFIIKGLYYANAREKTAHYSALIKTLANRLVQMYRHEATNEWQWFENYLTYGNSVLPEALLCAWMDSGTVLYRDVAVATFDFLLSKTLPGKTLQLISNNGWLHKGEDDKRCRKGGEQPIDAAYTILALERFYRLLKNNDYKQKMEIAFEWFLGNNHLNQVIYNPCTGGCYDGLEEKSVNLNQGAESTLSYLMARLTIEKSRRHGLLNKSKSYIRTQNGSGLNALHL
ncbi:MAG: mannosyltransferase, partial [Bacteroidia bacterium]|nr:mannosyltransferase [Bacteroidia bacterium]